MAETLTPEIPMNSNGSEVLETREWIDSLDYVLSTGGPERAGRLLQQLSLHARRAAGVNLPFTATTPYVNTIPSRQQPPFPGSQAMERRIKSLVRWNAMAMVVRAEQDAGRNRRSHLDLCLRRHALRSRLQSFPARENRRWRPRYGLFPGSRRARHVCPRLPRRTHSKRETGKFPPGAETGRRL